MKDIASKYKPYKPIELPDRTWPNNELSKKPLWCSVDLRDGNQALIEPMGQQRKKRMFELLCNLGFKEIEVGFPAASQTDYDFVRWLIEEEKIPSDVTIQVLTQARSHIIERTFEALRGVNKAIVHFYNSTSTLQRKVVFNQDKAGIKKIATDAAELVKKLAQDNPASEWSFEYSPESFTGTECDYAVEVCDAVVAILKNASKNKIIINLPATVEMTSPNIYADQIEWMHRNFKDRDNIILSLHPHNDRGTAVAATELALMAGADRVEGTLFGNGERTGNVDIVTLALNLLTHGIDPELDFTNINHVIREVEFCNKLPVHPRHPYAGDLVFTAFSGSHQDAIKKGLQALKISNTPHWEVPYLPIDPSDLGRTYEAVVRINSQSGKGGIAYILENDHGVSLPRRLQIALSAEIQKVADSTGREIISSEIWDIFEKSFMQSLGTELISFEVSSREDNQDSIEIVLEKSGKQERISAKGEGPLAAAINALNNTYCCQLSISEFHQHSIGSGSGASAITYIEIAKDKKVTRWGVGIDKNTLKSSIKAIICCFNKIT
ncbi:MAG: 2-isopropylmalate synthase [Gammaproteobacteria bacterium]